MTDLVACLIVYNEAQFLHKTLGNLNSIVDRMVIIDGAYEKFEHEYPWSTDGTIEMVKKLKSVSNKPIKLVEVKQPWPNQVTKRNKYLEFLDVGEWMMWIDGDEQPFFLTGALEEIKKGEFDGYCAEWVKTRADGQLMRIQLGNPRIVRMVKGMRYLYNHYSLFDLEGRCVYLPPYKVKPMFDVIKILHFNEQRDPERRRKIDAYYATRTEYASGIEGARFECTSCHYLFWLKPRELMECPRCGHRRPAGHAVNPDLVTQDKPYFSDPETEAMNKILTERQPLTVLEFGSGGSTFYFPAHHKFIKEWVSIEHNKTWFDYVNRKIAEISSNGGFGATRIITRLRSELTYYAEQVGSDHKYDMVLVDGQFRKICLALSRMFLKSGGCVILHDSKRKIYEPSFACFKKSRELVDPEAKKQDGSYINTGLTLFEN